MTEGMHGTGEIHDRRDARDSPAQERFMTEGMHGKERFMTEGMLGTGKIHDRRDARDRRDS